LLEVSAGVLELTDRYRDEFVHAEPFKHVVIENFFEPSFAEKLLTEFPKFDPDLSVGETGRKGGKSANPNIRSISPIYERLYEALSSRPFLDFVSRLSGIPDLLLDPKMFGGGTHENLHGQQLDPHVDFNYDESRQLHRRLNLIVYLNKDWRTEWGGALEIHSNPRKPFENRIRSFDPLFNRCVMFETNEYSWHGFPKIDLPEDFRHLSRKSISIYLYTRDRPEHEIAPEHATFYVQRPLPAHIAAGHALTEKEIDTVQRLLQRRDESIELYQQMELRKNRELAELRRYVLQLQGHARVPLTGYAVVAGETQGIHADNWATSRVKLCVSPLMPVSELLLRAHRPPQAPVGNVTLAVNGDTLATEPAREAFELTARLSKPIDDVFEIEILCDAEKGWSAKEGDDRDLAFFINELRVSHPGCKDPGSYSNRLRRGARLLNPLRRA
jgi:hypothetical protein